MKIIRFLPRPNSNCIRIVVNRPVYVRSLQTASPFAASLRGAKLRLARLFRAAVCRERKSLAVLLCLAVLGTSAVAKDRPSKAAANAQSDSLSQLYLTRLVHITDRAVEAYDSKNPKPRRLYRVTAHPASDTLLTPEKEAEIMREVDRRYAETGKDSLLTSDMIYVLKPYFEWLRYEDPHYRISPTVPINTNIYKHDRQFYKRLKTPAFDYLCVNDTIIVENSLAPQFRRGDMIVSINGITPREYLKYGYDDRYNAIHSLMRYYHYGDMATKFEVELLRDSRTTTVSTEGLPLMKAGLELSRIGATEKSLRIYEDAACGYISIPAFYPDNSRLIRIIRRAILDFRKRGCTNVILDLRRNLGGSGSRFDELMSIFIDRPVVKYCRGQRVKVSDRTIGCYDFLTDDMKGRLVDLPADEYAAEFPTIPKMFVEGMKYYVMMSRNTGSIAASFCNILQYNEAALLVGEPLMHNALKYGEVTYGRSFMPIQLRETCVSTVEIDEYTYAVDGVLMPDIPIPYVAADYLTGRDAMLEKLLEKIRSGDKLARKENSQNDFRR